jgi:hypothetical protein
MDLASQMVVNSIEIKDNQRVWDCCSGAGGKALLLTQKFTLLCIFEPYTPPNEANIPLNERSRVS